MQKQFIGTESIPQASIQWKIHIPWTERSYNAAEERWKVSAGSRCPIFPMPLITLGQFLGK